MSNLKFDDIDDWTPSSISIVDEPSHPLCKFEVYENDDEYVMKSISLEEGETMVENQNEPKVEVSESFLERFLGRSVQKADPVEEPPKEEPKTDDVAELAAKVDALEKRVAELEGKSENVEKEDETTPGAVTKSEGEGEATEGETATEEGEAEEKPAEEDNTEDEIIDEKKVVAKSVSIDPDTVQKNSSEKSLVERAGRKTNGMTW